MKMPLTPLLIVMSSLMAPAVFAAENDQAPPTSAAIPKGCVSFSGRYALSGGLYCKKMIGGLKSGAGKDWGPFLCALPHLKSY
jgi:hypothetical protein